jgi:heme/copper-type cytochrome/quinol oxidase subunit 3
MVLRTKEYFYDKVEELLALETSPVSETEKNIKRRKAKKLSHPFHLVDSSPWPILMSFAAFNLVIGLVAFMHRFENSYFQLIIGLSGVILILILWWRDVIREGTRDGMHTLPVQLNLKFGFALFIVSEVMFFFGFFWAYFHFSLAPSIQIGCVWPPAGIAVMDPLGIPLLNTVLLLISGITVTISHHALIHNRLKFSARALDLTIIYAILFVFHQILEYFDANFSINDGIYGSVFFLLTGFHGFHVIIGAIFLGVCFVRLSLGHFTCFHHVGLESAIWYWHFVDVVWLGLYISIYWWGSLFVNLFFF